MIRPCCLPGTVFRQFWRRWRESRAFCENMLKYTAYILSSGIGLAAPFFLAVPAGLPVPLLPVQTIWAGMLAGGLPAMAVAFNQPGGGMSRKTVNCPAVIFILKQLATDC
jgi:magnesium-transporting ATPase (P-type)